MKLVVVPNEVSNIDEYKKIGANAFIFGLKDFSSGYSLTLDVKEIKDVIEKNPDVEIFVAANKNIFNNELPELKEKLKEINDTKVKGVFFYDLAVLNIKLENNLSLDLVWNQTHMVTNYNTCNYYYEKGVKYGMLSGEITLEEINEIKDKTKMILFASVMGYPIMSFSKRTLLNNYFLSNNKKKDKNKYIISNNNEDYIIEEEDSGNAVFYGKPLNGSTVLNSIKADYLVLNEFNIEKETFKRVLSLYKRIIEEKNSGLVSLVDNILGDYRGFFYQKTIYKVKKND